MRWNILAMFGGTVELTGAFVIGGVIHQSVIQGNFPITAPAGVFGLIGGGLLILIGRKLEQRFEPSQYVPESEDEEDEEEDGQEFDEDLSPVPSERLEEREADDSIEE